MAAVKNLSVDQGTDFNAQLTVYDDNNAPWDLTGYTASAKIKKSYYSSNFVEFNVNFNSNRTTGIIIIDLTSTQTSSMEQGRYLYDIVIKDSSEKKVRVIEGIITINPGVT